jgi:hypothetical protein
MIAGPAQARQEQYRLKFLEIASENTLTGIQF